MPAMLAPGRGGAVSLSSRNGGGSAASSTRPVRTNATGRYGRWYAGARIEALRRVIRRGERTMVRTARFLVSASALVLLLALSTVTAQAAVWSSTDKFGSWSNGGY